ncbi:MAG: small multi-drug export protein [Ruminococcaceae bacterium]|nr:small multi-drug export protein [Oscillospiraceae bacterium]
MTETIISWFTGMNKELALFFMSMIPVLELRGSLLLAPTFGVEWMRALPICIVGNIIPVPFIILFLRPILNYLQKTKYFSKFANWLHNRSIEKADKIIKYEVLGLFLFVAIPLPGTGAWTGALIASILDIRLKKSLPAIILGVIAAGLIMTLGSYGIFNALINLFA